VSGNSAATTIMPRGREENTDGIKILAPIAYFFFQVRIDFHLYRKKEYPKMTTCHALVLVRVRVQVLEI
jgi:hypothetical protein